MTNIIDWASTIGRRILMDVVETRHASDVRTYMQEVEVEAVTASGRIRISFPHDREPTVWGYTNQDSVHVDRRDGRVRVFGFAEDVTDCKVVA